MAIAGSAKFKTIKKGHEDGMISPMMTETVKTAPRRKLVFIYKKP